MKLWWLTIETCHIHSCYHSRLSIFRVMAHSITNPIPARTFIFICLPSQFHHSFSSEQRDLGYTRYTFHFHKHTASTSKLLVHRLHSVVLPTCYIYFETVLCHSTKFRILLFTPVQLSHPPHTGFYISYASLLALRKCLATSRLTSSLNLPTRVSA